MFRTGIWRARVVNVNDPENRGRVQVRIPQLHLTPSGSTLGADAATAQGKVETVRTNAGGTEVEVLAVEIGVPNPPNRFNGVPDTALPWAEPCLPWGGQKRVPENKAPNGNVHEGFYMIPEVGSTVWVAFENGWVQRPVWLGSWYGVDELPDEIDPANPEKIRLIKTRIGHMLLFDDAAGKERVFLATADDDGLPDANSDGPRIRFLELDDAGEKLTLRNAPAGDDEQVLLMERTAKKITIINGTNQKIEVDGTASKTTVQNSPTQTVVQDATAGTTTITDGAVVVTLNATAGTITFTNGVTTITVDAVGNTTVADAGASLITLGIGAAQGVCLDSLITVIGAMVAAYNAHTHNMAVGAPPPSEQMTAPVIGVNSSSTVRAKL
jgi:hypothetical protein